MNDKLIEKILEKYLLGNDTIVEGKTVKWQEFIWKYVILRWYDSGVHFGILEKVEEDYYVLKDSRRLYRFWCQEWVWLTDLAQNWLIEKDSNKICKTIPLIWITDKRISEIIPCSEKAIESIKNYKDAEQD